MVDQIHEKGTSAQTLTENQKADNRRKSSIRCRIEHVFGFMTNTMKAMYIRTIGIQPTPEPFGVKKDNDNKYLQKWFKL